MEMLQIAGFSVAAAFAALTIRRQQPEMGLVLALCAGAILLTVALGQLQGVVAVMVQLCEKAQLKDTYLKMLLKVLGVSYLCEFAAQACRDAGEEGICQKVLLTGKIMIMALASPVMVSLVDIILSIAP